MPMPKAPIFIIIIAFASVAALVTMVAMNPIAFSGIVDIRSGYEPNRESIDAAMSGLDSGNMMGLAFPSRTIYSPGDAFSVVLAVRNQLQSGATFHINVLQESGPDGNIVLIYDSLLGTLGPGETIIRDIGMITYPDSPEGIYSYSVLVCASGSCVRDSPGFYSQERINFRLIG